MWQPNERYPDASVRVLDPSFGPYRLALASVVALNVPARGGVGDPARTLAICEMLAADRDDMVVKALSWALRSLVGHEPSLVRNFLTRHEDVLAARVRREVKAKLETGLKSRRRA